VRYFHLDRLGTRLVTDGEGIVKATQAVMPFGVPIAAESKHPANPRYKTWHREASPALDYAVNRRYDFRRGRFTQVDPLGLVPTELRSPQSLNLYTYVEDDPVNADDPLGLACDISPQDVLSCSEWRDGVLEVTGYDLRQPRGSDPDPPAREAASYGEGGRGGGGGTGGGENGTAKDTAEKPPCAADTAGEESNGASEGAEFLIDLAHGGPYIGSAALVFLVSWPIPAVLTVTAIIDTVALPFGGVPVSLESGVPVRFNLTAKVAESYATAIGALGRPILDAIHDNFEAPTWPAGSDRATLMFYQPNPGYPGCQ
jgi:RHS repeat-associated protein